MADQDSLETVVNRNAFYRDGYRLMMRVVIIEAVIILLLVAGLMTALLSSKIEHVFFATTTDGRLINIVPLNDPYLSRAEVVSWGAENAKRVFDFNPQNYRQRLQDSMPNFTLQGWETFTKALEESQILQRLEKAQSTVSAQVTAAPQVLEEREVGGVYKWLLQMPMTISFQGGRAEIQPLRITLYLTIVRVSTLQNPKGVAIEQWVAKPA